MNPGRKPTRSREEFVQAAINLADEAGISNLSLRALGAELGAATTAVYRYFANKDDLIVAMRESLLAEAIPTTTGGEARARLMAAALAFRDTARRHPCLSQIMGLAALEGVNSSGAMRLIAQGLEELGLSGPLLVRGYRQLETFVVGASAYDFSDAPRHLEDRLARMRLLDHQDFDDVLVDVAAVEADNERAFITTFTWILDGLVAEAK
jgi:AcrR family transcriptional regulator